GEGRDAFARDVAEVAGVRDIAEAEADRVDIAVLLADRQRGDDAAGALDADRFARRQPVLGQDRRILTAGRRLKAIAEAHAHDLRRGRVEVDVDPAAAAQKERAQ